MNPRNEFLGYLLWATFCPDSTLTAIMCRRIAVVRSAPSDARDNDLCTCQGKVPGPGLRSRLRRVLSGYGPGSCFRSLSSRLNVSMDEAGVWLPILDFRLRNP